LAIYRHFIGDNICHDPEERLLEADSDSDEDLADDKSVHVSSACPDNAANESNCRADDENPCKPLSAHQFMTHWNVTCFSPSSSE
jgi:hypothetical protein